MAVSKGSQADSTTVCWMGDSVGTSLLHFPGYLKYPRAEVVIPLGCPSTVGWGRRGHAWLCSWLRHEASVLSLVDHMYPVTGQGLWVPMRVQLALQAFPCLGVQCYKQIRTPWQVKREIVEERKTLLLVPITVLFSYFWKKKPCIFIFQGVPQST